MSASSDDSSAALVPLARKAVTLLEEQQEQLTKGELDPATNRLAVLDAEFAPLLVAIPGLSKCIKIEAAPEPSPTAAPKEGRGGRSRTAVTATKEKEEAVAPAAATADERETGPKSSRKSGAQQQGAAGSSSSSSGAAASPAAMSRVSLAAHGGFYVYKEANLIRNFAMKQRAAPLFREPVTEEEAPGYAKMIKKPVNFKMLKGLIDGLLQEPGPGGAALASTAAFDADVAASLKNPDAIPPSQALPWQRIDSIRDLGNLLKLMADNCVTFNGDDSDYAKGAIDLWKAVSPRIDEAVAREDAAVEVGRKASLAAAAGDEGGGVKVLPIRSRRGVSLGAAGGVAAGSEDEAASTATGRDEEIAAASSSASGAATAGKKRKRGDLTADDEAGSSAAVVEDNKRGKRQAVGAEAPVAAPAPAPPAPEAGAGARTKRR